MRKHKKDYIKILISICFTVFIAMGLSTTIAFCAGNSTLEFDDSAIVSGGAEKFWDGFGYSYKYKNFIFNIEDNESITIYDCDEKAKGTVTIPSKLFGFKVRVGSDDEGIGQHIFEDCNNVTKIVVSEGIKYVGNGAFSGCTSVKEIVLPDSLEQIFVYAFNGCTSLRKLNIPNSVKEIGVYAFTGSNIESTKSNWKNGVLYWDNCLIDVDENCDGKLVVEKGTRKIASGAFDWAVNLREVVLLESVTTISSGIANQPCGISRINIPKNVNYIGDSFLCNCSLECIDVDSNNKYYRDIDGSLLTKNMEIYIRNVSQINGSPIRDIYKIPESVKVIRSGAFQRSLCDEVVIPESTEVLEGGCFFNSYIKRITIPKNVKEIGNNLFYLSSSLKTVDLLCDIKNIPYGMFGKCTNLKSITIPEGVEKIEGRAFEDCQTLTEVRLPATLKDIPSVFYGANGCIFEGCTNLKNIIVDKNNKYYTVKDGILYNKAMTRLIRYPEAYSVKNVVIPSSVKKINSGAFKNCRNIVSVELPQGIEYISENLFENCKNLKNIKLPSSVRAIEFAAFRGCSSLDNITIPKTVIKINDQSLGFKYEDGSLLKIKGFKIKGYKGSVAETYAKENGLKFESIGTVDKNYNTKLNLDISKQLRWLPCESFMEGNVIFLLDSLEGIYAEELIYSSNYMLYDTNWLPIKDEQLIGSGTKFIVIPLGESVFIEYFFVRMGDVSGDGLVDKKDLDIAKTYIGRKVANDDFASLAIDLNYDRKITKEDISLLEGVIAGKKIEKKPLHTYKTTTTKATLTKNGKIENKCSVCGYSKTTTIYYPKTIKLSKTEYTYNGKEQTPSVTVKDSKGNVLKKDTDYTVKNEGGRTATGRYNVKITFKGKYSGTKTLTYTIAPKVISKISAFQSTKAIKLTWNKVTGADGYRVYQYNAKTKTWDKIKTLKETSYKVENLKAGTIYRFRIKAYKKDDGTIWGNATDIFETATKCTTPSITKLTTTKGKASYTWSIVSGESGFQVYYSTKKDSGYKKVASYKANVISGSKSKLTSGQTYYFKVRAYIKTDSGTVFSDWSAVKSIKIK